MKRNSYKSQLKPQTIEALDKFSQKIGKNKNFYDKFHSILVKEFDQILKEEINVCICCGVECIGKSIGPHYKNSKKCANFKREKEGRLEGYEIQSQRPPLNAKDTNVKIKVQLMEKEHENKISHEENYDELNEYFDSF